MGDEDLKKYMPAIFYKDIKDNLLKISKQQDVGTCIVCLCDFEDNENVRSTYCRHIFHSNCLTDWMKKNESCPYCRSALNKGNILEIFDQHKNNSLNWLDQIHEKQIDSKDQVEGQNDQGQTHDLGEINKKNRVKSQNQIENEEELVTYQKSTQELKNQTEQPKKEQRKSLNPNKRTSLAVQDERSQQGLINPLIIQYKKVAQVQPQEDFSIDESKEQKHLAIKISQKDNNRSKKNKKTGLRLQHQTSIEQTGQNNSTNNTPRKDINSSTIDLQGFVQSSDSISLDGQIPSQGNIAVNRVKKSQFMNNSKHKNQNMNESNTQLTNIQNSNIVQNLSMDSKIQGNNSDSMNSDDQVERLNNIDYSQTDRVYQDKVIGLSPNQASKQPQTLHRRNNAKKLSKFVNIKN